MEDPEDRRVTQGHGEEDGVQGDLQAPSGDGAEVADAEESRGGLGAKDRHIRGLYDELAGLRLAADEAAARTEAALLRVQGVEEERERLRARLREMGEEERGRRRRRDGQDRRMARLEREIERREADVQRLREELRKKDELLLRTPNGGRQSRPDPQSRKDAALEDALRRIKRLERDLEEREEEATALRTRVAELRAELDREIEHKRRAAEAAASLRAGVDLFNLTDRTQEVASISKSLGVPEVHVSLEEGENDEPTVILCFTWRGVTWRTYAAQPGPATEPRVRLRDHGEDLSGVDREPPNARLGPDGGVVVSL